MLSSVEMFKSEQCWGEGGGSVPVGLWWRRYMATTAVGGRKDDENGMWHRPKLQVGGYSVMDQGLDRMNGWVSL